MSSPHPTPVAAAASANSICGNQPLCYEASDFAATVTDFRTTTQGYYKIIDVSVRFTNKSTTPLALAYATGSGMATDDRGNRYAVGGANGSRGIGTVSGNTFDAKMVMRPGGYADARFELLFSPGQAVLGLTYELDLTVNELNAVEGNQFTLGGEFPLQFKSLVNGSTGPAPGPVTYTSAGQVASAGSPPPCGPAGTATSVAGATNSSTVQGATNSAATAATNTSNAISSIGSLFGKKKPAANSAAAAPCTAPSVSAAPAATAAPAAATAASAGRVVTPVNTKSVSNVAPAAAASSRTATTAVVATPPATAPKAQTTPATTPATAPATTAAATTVKSATPTPALTKNPPATPSTSQTP